MKWKWKKKKNHNREEIILLNEINKKESQQ